MADFIDEVIALRVRGFWSYSKYGRPTDTNSVFERWIIFTSKHPVALDYVTYDDLFSDEAQEQIKQYNLIEVDYRRKVLHALDIIDSLENDDQIALWEVNSGKKFPRSIQTSDSDFYKEQLSNYNLTDGAFVQALAESGLKEGLCFAITELLKVRIAAIKDKKTILVKKTPDSAIEIKNGKNDDSRIEEKSLIGDMRTKVRNIEKSILDSGSARSNISQNTGSSVVSGIVGLIVLIISIIVLLLLSSSR